MNEHKVVDGETCRFCGSQEGFRVFIFDQGSDHIKKIKSILPIEVSEADGLPKFMCYRCTYKLKESYAFQQQCMKTDALLRSERSLPQVLHIRRTGSVLLSGDVASRKHLSACRLDDGGSAVKKRSGKRKSSPHKRKLPKVSPDNVHLENGNTSEKKKPANVQIKNASLQMESDSSGTSVSELGKSKTVKVAVIGAGSSDNTGTCQSADSGMDASGKRDLANGAGTEGAGAPKSNTMKSEELPVKIPANILVTKIPGSCCIYTCQTCDRCFVSEEAAGRHDCSAGMEAQASSMQDVADAREYVCEHCSKKFTRYVSLLAHQEALLRCFADEELEEDEEYALLSTVPLDNAAAKKTRKRLLSTSSEEEEEQGTAANSV